MVKYEQKQNIFIIIVDRSINLMNISQLKEIFEKIINESVKQVIIDCYEADYLASNALGEIAQLIKRIRSWGGDIKFIGINETIIHCLEVCGILNLIEIYDSEAEAITSFGNNVGSIEKRLLWRL